MDSTGNGFGSELINVRPKVDEKRFVSVVYTAARLNNNNNNNNILEVRSPRGSLASPPS